MKHKIFWKEVRRSIYRSLGRFLAIACIVALGAGFLAGLMTCRPVMETTVSNYMEASRYMDFKIQSTLGLTEEDIKALQETEGVSAVEASQQLDLLTNITGKEGEAVVRFAGLPAKMNQLVLMEGRMPESEGECVVNPGKHSSGGVHVGDQVTVLEEGLAHKTYTVVGLVNSAQYLSMTLGTTTKGSGSLDYIAYVPLEEFESEYYTIAYIKATALEGVSAFSSAYEEAADQVQETLESVASERIQTRYEQMLLEAGEQLSEARDQYLEEKSKIESELVQAGQEVSSYEKELADSQKQMEQGQQQYEAGTAALAQGWQTYESSYNAFTARRDQTYSNLQQLSEQLTAAQAELDQAGEQLAAKGAELTETKEQLDAAKTELETVKAELDAQSAALDQAAAELDAAYQQLQEKKPAMTPEDYEKALLAWQEESDAFYAQQRELAQGLAEWQARQEALTTQEEELSEATAAYETQQAQLTARGAQLAEQWQNYENTRAQALSQLESAEQQLENLRQTLLQRQSELEESQALLTESEQALETAREELKENQELLAQSQQQADQELESALAAIESGEQQLADIPKAQWYVLGRSMDESFISFKNDAQRMGKIATVFPWMFFIVAALVSLTTMTRMVEEQRQQIGTYKALGIGNRQILGKYLVYAGSASLFGAALGIGVGFQVLPRVVCAAYGVMYMLPQTQVQFYVPLALLSGVTALLCTLGATLAACLRCLRSRPAALMVPEAPKAGKRIWLEKITPLWNRLSFIRKVTARNLFRYKKRFFMTVIGIAGCTGLLLTGFGLKDSIMDIVENQFHKVYAYDGVLGIEDEDKSRETLANSAALQSTLHVYSKMADVQSESATVSAYLYVPESAEKLTEMIRFQTRTGEEPVAFDENTIVITEKLAERLGVSVGEIITLKDADGLDTAFTVGGITENYLYNYVYMPQRFFTDALGFDLTYNQILFTIADGYTPEQVKEAFSGRAGQEENGIATVQVLDDMIEPVRQMISSLNLVVLVLIVSAGMLAFIVLYNLTNINITERQRELATIKVLGFHPAEVSAYIFRETTLLTLIGCVLGLGVGVIMHRFVITTVEVDMVMFGRTIHAVHYVWAALMTMAFSAVVDFVMHFKLRKISMIESLKSVD